MSSLANSFINALLMDATYALKINNWNNKTGLDLEGVLSERMTPIFAKYIGENFTVVTHIETNDVVASDFDATVWKDNFSGKILDKRKAQPNNYQLKQVVFWSSAFNAY